MKKEKIEKELLKAYEQKEQIDAKVRDLEQQLQEAEDAETMRVIKKHRITADQLIILNKLSEEDIKHLLEQKEKEKSEHEKELVTQV